jgi:uncharacterized protein YutD
MDNWHVRLNFNLSKEKGINTTAIKNIIKLVKLQNWVAKYCKDAKFVCLYFVRKLLPFSAQKW